MRLEKIKLAGFKSFVDPTVVPMPSNLVAVVGPNGCGKSNVIDAVRWVMGESSAKMLRGESMADVIFNGSSARKPVGSAVIELLFDNSDGSAGGQYAKYSHISVKRQVSRDGQSSYFLNGTRCRRRDITDLFLGTGLGPRSYSIIEQGTISRLIEARPEELRVFLEEAAGISKYKERRRETENRIRHTRENLERLDDLREEVAKHLQRLERQAATAEKYKKLRAEERRLKAELLALRWRSEEHERTTQEGASAELETAVEAALAQQRHLEAGLEEGRERQHEAGDLFNEVQGRFYAAGAEIARLEQSLQYNRDSARRQERELGQVQGELDHARGQLEQDQGRLEELAETLARQEPELERCEAEQESRAEALDQAEEMLHAWQSEWDDFNRAAAEPAQSAQVERTRINHLEQQATDLERRLQRLGDELGRLDDPDLDQELAALEESEQVLEQRLEQQRELQQELDGRIRDLRGGQAESNRELDAVKGEQQSARGRMASLEALQQAARQDGSEALQEWLQANALDQSERLADRTRADRRWQRATEVVLGERLQALCVDSLEQLGPALAGVSAGPLELFETATTPADPPEPDSLLAQVQAPWPLHNLLQGVRLADTLEQALARRTTLGAGESLVTPEGACIGPDWLRLPGEQQAGSGVLERGAELEALTLRSAELESTAEVLEQRLTQEREALEQAEFQRGEVQRELDRLNREQARVRSDLSAKRARREHMLQRRETVTGEQQEISEQIALDRETMAEARERLHDALEAIETLTERREALVGRRDGLRAAREQARHGVKEVDGRSRQLALEVESARTARQSLLVGLERARRQLEQLEQRRADLEQSMASATEPLQELEAELERQLAVRVEVEQELARAREQVETVETALREGEQARLRAEQEVQKRRAELEQVRLRRQEVLIRCRTLEEQLKEAGYQAVELLELLPSEAGEAQWQEQVEKIAVRIQRLGNINLAAIDEYKEEAERKGYLDAQHEDITRSLETLEDAIRKIDRETRTRFKETFDKVNGGLQTLFPRLFGGGHAYLELTGEDLLDTGVSVMARPPGKRNSSIYLLSGGEKALTAVALVFAIFQLNPAPFCMLDEVDAPLDDANVGRFCELVKSMSDQVQFIFITHNKITMELANQLTGVTMHEPGVSRLVSVDVDEAVQLAAI